MQGFQVAMIESKEVAPYLDSIGVPPGVPLAIAATPRTEAPRPAATQPAAVESATEPAWASAEDPF